MQLTEIQFPVYLIGEEFPIEEDDMVYIEEKVGSEEEPNILIIDDKSVDADSFAMRRLKLKTRNANLKKLGSAIYYLADLIKFSTPKLWFVDSNGKPFRYIKQKTFPLVCKKITKVIDIPTGGSLIEVEGMSCRFKTLHTADVGMTYAGIILIGHGSVLYGLYPAPFSSTRRKV